VTSSETQVLDQNGDVLAPVPKRGHLERPTWVAFTPWTRLADYREMLDFIEAEGLIDHVDPVQYSLRLLVPPGSLLLGSPALRPHVGPLDGAALSYRWTHPDPRMDRLQQAAVERLSGRLTISQPDPRLVAATPGPAQCRCILQHSGRPATAGERLPLAVSHPSLPVTVDEPQRARISGH
jgi:hypothetical protein